MNMNQRWEHWRGLIDQQARGGQSIRCWLLKGDSPVFISRLDSLATLVLSFYSLYHFLPQIWINFRALADFPLDENAQLKIMAILARVRVPELLAAFDRIRRRNNSIPPWRIVSKGNMSEGSACCIFLIIPFLS